VAEYRRGIQTLLVCIFTAMLGLGIIGPIMPLYAEDLGASFVQIGLLGSAWSVSRFIFTAPIGRLSDTRSKKKIIAVGLSVYAAVSILYALAWDFTSLVTVRFLHGLGSAMAMPVAMAYAAGLAPVGQEGRYMGTMNLAMFAGMGMGPFIGGSLTDLFSMSAPFYVMGALTAFSLTLTLVFLPEEVRQGGRVDRPRPSFRDALSNGIMRAAFAYRTVSALGYGSIMNFLSIYISGAPEVGGLGLSVSTAGLILSLGQVSSALMQRPFGDMADRHSKILLTLLGGLFAVVGFALFPFANNAWEVLAAQLVFSAGGAIGQPAITAMVAIEGRGIGMGTAFSVLESAMSFGMIAGPIVAGIVVDAWGLRPVFFVGGLITLIGIATFFFMHRYAERG
jgi:MFS family permease